MRLDPVQVVTTLSSSVKKNEQGPLLFSCLGLLREMEEVAIALRTVGGFVRLFGLPGCVLGGLSKAAGKYKVQGEGRDDFHNSAFHRKAVSWKGYSTLVAREPVAAFGFGSTAGHHSHFTLLLSNKPQPNSR